MAGGHELPKVSQVVSRRARNSAREATRSQGEDVGKVNMEIKNDPSEINVTHKIHKH